MDCASLYKDIGVINGFISSGLEYVWIRIVL